MKFERLRLLGFKSFCEPTDFLIEPGLIRKTFIYDPEAGQAGAFYLWQRRADAERAHDEAWRQRIRSSYGSEPVVQYFETPLVVDNALGRLVEEAPRP